MSCLALTLTLVQCRLGEEDPDYLNIPMVVADTGEVLLRLNDVEPNKTAAWRRNLKKKLTSAQNAQNVSKGVIQTVGRQMTTTTPRPCQALVTASLMIFGWMTMGKSLLPNVVPRMLAIAQGHRICIPRTRVKESQEQKGQSVAGVPAAVPAVTQTTRLASALAQVPPVRLHTAQSPTVSVSNWYTDVEAPTTVDQASNGEAQGTTSCLSA